MLIDLLTNILCMEFEDKILVTDKDKIISETTKIGFNDNDWVVINYTDVEYFRYMYESKILNNHTNKYLIISNSDIYIPFDIRSVFYIVDIAYEKIFPKIDSYAIRTYNKKIDLDLLSIAYENHFGEALNELDTYNFLEKKQYAANTIKTYVTYQTKIIENMLIDYYDYKTWFKIADILGYIRFLLCKASSVFDVNEIHTKINNLFEDFILKYYNMLSSLPIYNSPVLLNKVLDYMFVHRNDEEKMALIIMDGMSVFDWKVIESQLSGYYCNVKYSFALIPTITSISRKSLLSGKLPVEHKNLFSLAQEESLFYNKVTEMGVKKRNVYYHKGYDYTLSGSNKIIALIFNDVDDIIHKQTPGDNGTYSDILRYCKTEKLQDTITSLLRTGYKVFLTSDHGNTRSIGIGNAPNKGIELENKCQKALVYKEYSDVNEVLKKYDLIDYPKYYLSKSFYYLLCKHGMAFGIKNQQIYTHGGITLEEVIVPFIEIKE